MTSARKILDMSHHSGQQYQHFPDGAVYPGHPTCIAYLIMLKYPDLKSAREKPSAGAPYGNALSDSDIPGAGGNVHGALDLLQRASLLGPEAAFEFGEAYWRSCASGTNFGNNHDSGKEQADRIKEAFLAKAAAWCTAVEPAPSAPSHF